MQWFALQITSTSRAGATNSRARALHAYLALCVFSRQSKIAAPPPDVSVKLPGELEIRLKTRALLSVSHTRTEIDPFLGGALARSAGAGATTTTTLTPVHPPNINNSPGRRRAGGGALAALGAWTPWTNRGYVAHTARRRRQSRRARRAGWGLGRGSRKVSNLYLTNVANYAVISTFYYYTKYGKA